MGANPKTEIKTVNKVYVPKFNIMTSAISIIHPFYGTYDNSADPHWTPHNVLSDRDLHCLLTDCSIKLWKTMKGYEPKA